MEFLLFYYLRPHVSHFQHMMHLFHLQLDICLEQKCCHLKFTAATSQCLWELSRKSLTYFYFF